MPTSYEPNNKIFAQFDKAIQNGLTAAGLIVQNQADINITANDNIDTGRLKGSITYATRRSGSTPRFPAVFSDKVQSPNRDDVVFIGTNVNYAKYIEYSIKGKAKPFLRPALDMSISRIKQTIANEFKKVLA
jgi:hypothetical protein